MLSPSKRYRVRALANQDDLNKSIVGDTDPTGLVTNIGWNEDVYELPVMRQYLCTKQNVLQGE